MATLLSTGLSLPKSVTNRVFPKIQYGSTIAALGNPEPMLFGDTEYFHFDIGEAEYVGEGANKSGSTATKTTVTVKPYKFQKTVRYSQEVMWADEDYQLGILNNFADAITPALARALDYGVFHGINPLDGALVAAMTTNGKLSQTTNSVEIAPGDKPYANIDAAKALVLADGYIPSDIALDPSFAALFTSLRNTTTEQKLYPDFQLGTAPSNLDGTRASTSKTVGAVGVAAAATTVKAIVGDFSKVVWGVQRRIGLEVIQYGDPDGDGDLKRNNQIALRSEILYGWAIADKDAFAKIIDAV